MRQLRFASRFERELHYISKTHNCGKTMSARASSGRKVLGIVGQWRTTSATFRKRRLTAPNGFYANLSVGDGSLLILLVARVLLSFSNVVYVAAFFATTVG